MSFICKSFASNSLKSLAFFCLAFFCFVSIFSVFTFLFLLFFVLVDSDDTVLTTSTAVLSSTILFRSSLTSIGDCNCPYFPFGFGRLHELLQKPTYFLHCNHPLYKSILEKG